MPNPVLRCLFILALAFSAGPSLADDGSCSDPMDQILEKANAQWPESRPIHLSPEWVQYFVRGYNDQADRGEDLVADTVVVYPMDESYATWYVIAGFAGCMTFWIDLSPHKAYHLIELGYALSEDL